MNDDGKLDLVSGDSDGAIWLFYNKGSITAPKLGKGEMVKSNGKVITAPKRIYKKVDGEYKLASETPGSNDLAEKYSKIEVADWNGDGLHDLLVGHSKRTFVLYYNEGTKAEPVFKKPCELKPSEGEFPSRPSPHVADWDKDGIKDLLVGSERGKVYFYRNKGTNTAPVLESGIELKAGGFVISEGLRARLCVTDWNNDGKLDLVVGNFFSNSKSETSKESSIGGNLWLYLAK